MARHDTKTAEDMKQQGIRPTGFTRQISDGGTLRQFGLYIIMSNTGERYPATRSRLVLSDGDWPLGGVGLGRNAEFRKCR
jgi:hypothetical protein